tara:strand:+ start:1324 stop:1608 length:285 start_codon:yes stop_codon:yes gene_type:complete
MEKNTINLSVEDYNKMRDFNEAIRKENCVRVFMGWHNREEQVCTKDEVVKLIAEANVKLKEKINELKNHEKKQPSFDELREMSWWQFRKWKRGL